MHYTLKDANTQLPTDRLGGGHLLFPWAPFTASTVLNMSYYFSIVGTRDNPLFEIEFGTSKAGGDGIARFREEARHMNQFIVHSSLDIVEEVQWGNNGL